MKEIINSFKEYFKRSFLKLIIVFAIVVILAKFSPKLAQFFFVIANLYITFDIFKIKFSLDNIFKVVLKMLLVAVITMIILGAISGGFFGYLTISAIKELNIDVKTVTPEFSSNILMYIITRYRISIFGLSFVTSFLSLIFLNLGILFAIKGEKMVYSFKKSFRLILEYPNIYLILFVIGVLNYIVNLLTPIYMIPGYLITTIGFIIGFINSIFVKTVLEIEEKNDETNS